MTCRILGVALLAVGGLSEAFPLIPNEKVQAVRNTLYEISPVPWLNTLRRAGRFCMEHALELLLAGTVLLLIGTLLLLALQKKTMDGAILQTEEALPASGTLPERGREVRAADRQEGSDGKPSLEEQQARHAEPKACAAPEPPQAFAASSAPSNRMKAAEPAPAASREPMAAPQPAASVACPACGVHNDARSVFCRACGTDLRDLEAITALPEDAALTAALEAAQAARDAAVASCQNSAELLTELRRLNGQMDALLRQNARQAARADSAPVITWSGPAIPVAVPQPACASTGCAASFAPPPVYSAPAPRSEDAHWNGYTPNAAPRTSGPRIIYTVGRR